MPAFLLLPLTRDMPYSPMGGLPAHSLPLEFSDLQGCEPGGRELRAELISQGSSSVTADKAGREAPEARTATPSLPHVDGPLLLWIKIHTETEQSFQ